MKTRYFTDETQIESNALTSLRAFEEQENISEIAVFPDIHYCSEKSIPVGVAFRTTDVFYPLVTGKDMGCGVAYMRFGKKDVIKNFDKDKHYRAFDKESQTMTDEGLGGGNHFLSIEESDEYLYVIVHTGSRNLGIWMYQENYALLQKHNPGRDWLPIEIADEEYITQYERVLNYAKERRLNFLTGTKKFLIRNGYIKNTAVGEVDDSHHNSIEFTDGEGVIHRKGSTQLLKDWPVIIPLSMSRGSLIVKANKWDPTTREALSSCSHGAGRKYSRTDTLKYWHSLKKAEKDAYKKKFSELINRSGEFDSSILQEFDFAYKDSETILQTQPYLFKVDETRPIATVKFTAV